MRRKKSHISDQTARRMASGNLVLGMQGEVNVRAYTEGQKMATAWGKNTLRKRHKQERQRVRLARRASKAWRKRK